MPRNAILPIHRYLLGSLPPESRRVQQKIDPRREWLGAQNIYRSKPVGSETVGPVLHFGKMTTCTASVVMIHD
jgi:hypothetical protein